MAGRPLSLLVLAVAGAVFFACASSYERGEQLYRQGDPGGAVTVWQTVPESHHDYARTHARIELVEGELEQALDRYVKRAEFFEGQARLAEAVLYYRLAVKFDPSRTTILDHIQILYRQLRQREAQERVGLTEALRAFDLRRAAQHAETLEKLNPFDPAIQIDVHEVRATIDVEVLRHMVAGERAFSANDRAAARESFGEVLALEPDNEEARGYLKVLRDAESLGERGKLYPLRSISRAEILAEGHFSAAEAARGAFCRASRSWPVARRRQQLCSAAALALALASCAGLRDDRLKSLFLPHEELVFDPSSNLLPPDSARVTSNEDRQIVLSWNPILVGDVAGYAILRTSSPGGPYTRLGTTESRFGTVFSDTGEAPGALGDGKTYFYRIHAYDSAGRVSGSHANLEATTEAPPPVPEGLRVYSGLPRIVVLEWEPSERRTVRGYVVYRCPTTAGPWERVTDVRSRLQTVYVDSVPGDLRVMYYRIRARNRFGGESAWTEPIRAVTKAEPLPPIGLEVTTRRLGEVRIAWEANVEPDLLSYEIWRSQRDGTGWGERRLLAQVPGDEGTFRDGAVGCGETVRYELRASDADSLISAFSRPLDVTGEDIDLQFGHNAASGAWELHWDAQRTSDWPAVRITQIRRVLPDREFGSVTGVSRFAFPEGFRPTGELAVTPIADELPTDQSGGKTPNQPSCRIGVPHDATDPAP